MENYTDEPESSKPEGSASVETRATKKTRQHLNRATLHDVFSRRDLKWRREGTDDVLYCGRRRLLRLVPDATYPGMWRVAYPDGELGDRKNLTWARHEGVRVALSLLNKRIVPGTSQRSPLTAAGHGAFLWPRRTAPPRSRPLKRRRRHPRLAATELAAR